MIGTDASSTSTSIESNIAAVRRFWDAFNAHSLAVWDEVCSASFVNHDPGLPTPDADLPTIKQAIGAMLAAAAATSLQRRTERSEVPLAC